ncbi:MAG: bifunctional ornithine acetyltransferase/N-acetylglutamate synthase [Candidatus Omnitrophica bacterium CG11_big_fil_rev_8_21_14_0_20_63_9]|nr:MAG: bifunctional ornithine acetyltransferase/N-acetylglutamate synthase [Candidatus Omnitrophica bacterium CG11_big_fil_rev_8_21_14_0_20_63_9]
MRWIRGGVTAAEGFIASGVSAGIKRGRKLDLALVSAQEPSAAAAVFTSNRVQAAPVLISKARVRSGLARAVLINSGCANCMTGAAGYRDAMRLSRVVAQPLGIPESQVLIASTGIIGRRLPVQRIERAIPRLVAQRSRAHHAEAAQAILTTDLHVKEAAVELVIGGHRCRLGGMIKGSGMIAPSMATMLSVVTTDVAIAPVLLRRLLRNAVGQTCNAISVDGDMSTNDTVFALASGCSGAIVRPGRLGERQFAHALTMLLQRLAELLVADGEGASRIMEVHVTGAKTSRQAQACARQVALSPLVKTMLAGADPNVGRVAAAAGASGAVFDPQRLEMFIGPRRVVAGGAALPLGKAVARRLLRQPKVVVRLELHAGSSEGRMLTCDLTEEYVRINARYST